LTVKGLKDNSENGEISYLVDGEWWYVVGMDMRKNGGDESFYSYGSLCNLMNVIYF